MARTPERQAMVDEVLRLTAEGLSRAEIATRFGVTRNSIRGIVRDNAHHLTWQSKSQWTPERIDQLRTLVKRYSYTATAGIMGIARSGVQRAVAKYAPDAARPVHIAPKRTHQAIHRATRNSMNPAKIAARNIAARIAYTPPPAEPPRGCEVRLMGLEPGMCRYPVAGEGAAMMFCGSRDNTDERPPYCPHHAALAYVPQENRSGAVRAQNAAGWMR